MSNYEMCMTDEEFIRYNSYLRKMSKINPKFILDKTFSVSDEDIEKGKSLINEIENLAKDIKKAKTPKERNAINREKGKKLEELAGVMFNSAGLYSERNNLRDHTNEIDLLLIADDYNKLHKTILPEYLQNDILIECKNYNKTIKVDWVGKFFSLLTTHDGELGIIFSFDSFSGPGEWQSAKGLAKKIFLSEKRAILNIELKDIKEMLDNKGNIVSLIKEKYDALKHHVDFKALIKRHPAEK
ncbi:restriction endonuclease [Clostridium perfringens]|uniref:Restriction endonuclease type IV Mrr domain-containing protein n=1 Tax=Clostridium perfringens (strain ATCC 13124 / DSM 756 / JCM 1290 / NCIMB 6125 / NCTC 8237 / Type A) TaxID=195103 RepID=A0A0H2YQV4_CLOP1|nr:restriction endonuclease [Clostridium perfringens]STB11401.1 Uncharacterised protein [Clostridium novyi]ABG82952.1 conserved hypothetical protein [Clostridium perfringens ATCC 13124]MDK0830129.1 restriction endonuclease [Clostridium perfringens]MDM0811943.1 restriction endonuclease [Clostridium perfringens]MDM0884970.1 restriction endonuclease [Clostridium perfringens]